MTEPWTLTPKEKAKVIRDRYRHRRAKEAKASRQKPVRPVAVGQRDPREKDGPYLSAIRRAPCLFCAVAGRVQVARTEAAHVKTGYPTEGRGWRHFGVQEKSHDWRALPSCTACHRAGQDAQHDHKESAWYAERGIYPPDACRALRAAYEAGGDLAEAVLALARGLNGVVSRRDGADKGGSNA